MCVSGRGVSYADGDLWECRSGVFLNPGGETWSPLGSGGGGDIEFADYFLK